MLLQETSSLRLYGTLEAVAELLIRENVPLAPLTTLGVGGPARFFAVAGSEPQVAQAVAWAEDQRLPLFVLGGGSNLLVSDAGFGGLVLQIAIKGVVSCGTGCLQVGAGEVWDEFVERCVQEKLGGVECLAGIPGSVGGTPVQNVGAYGQEVAETIVSVRAFDRLARQFLELDHEACKFRYRKSLFNSDALGRYIVTNVRYQLHPNAQAQVTYVDVKRYFEGSNQSIDFKSVAASVRSIRQRKGMLITEGDSNSRSAGSFFKNPVVRKDRLDAVEAASTTPAAEIPHWSVGADEVKLSAAWLIEHAGFGKGFVDGPAGISSRHTLALINRGGAKAADIERLQKRIVEAVQTKFGVELEREPVWVG